MLQGSLDLTGSGSATLIRGHQSSPPELMYKFFLYCTGTLFWGSHPLLLRILSSLLDRIRQTQVLVRIPILGFSFSVVELDSELGLHVWPFWGWSRSRFYSSSEPKPRCQSKKNRPAP